MCTRSPLVGLVLIFVFATSLNASVIYSDGGPFPNWGGILSGMEYGPEITLAGSARMVSSISVELSDGSPAPVTLTARIYAADGGGGPAPGGLLGESTIIASLDDFAFVGGSAVGTLVSFPFPDVTVGDDIIVTVESSEFYRFLTDIPPTPEVGTRVRTWIEWPAGSGAFLSDPGTLGGLRIEAGPDVIPEPGALIIWSLLGVLGITVGWWRRRR